MVNFGRVEREEEGRRGKGKRVIRYNREKERAGDEEYSSRA